MHLGWASEGSGGKLRSRKSQTFRVLPFWWGCIFDSRFQGWEADAGLGSVEHPGAGLRLRSHVHDDWKVLLENRRWLGFGCEFPTGFLHEESSRKERSMLA